MYLATADMSGGISQRHLDHLPTILLMAEFCAVADDTIDRAPTRSGRVTFSARFGDASAVPFASALSSLVLARSRHDKALFEAAMRFFMEFFGLELWEREHTYPDRALFGTWLEHRYLQATVATEYALNCGRLLSEQSPWPRAAVSRFALVGQDVDDIVNLVEYSEASGENDDLQSGIVTRPLIYAVEDVPSLADDVDELWAYYRPLCSLQLPIAELRRQRAEILGKTLPLYAHIRGVVIERGVPRSVNQCLTDLDVAVGASPASLQPLMHDLTTSFLDRLQRCQYAEVPV